MSSTTSIPTITKKEFSNLLRKRQHEDMRVLQTVEKTLLKKRGYIFSMPKPTTPVILLLSGGLDSILMWAFLMHIYKLNVYPIYLIRSHKKSLLKPEVKSIHYYSKLYQEKYSHLYHPAKIICAPLPNNKLIKNTYKYASKNSRFLFAHINDINGISIEPLGLMTILGFQALEYSRLLLAKQNLSINTIFCGVLASDGIVVKSQTLTALRTTMLSMCTSSSNYKIQYSSIAFEKELGHFFNKQFFIQWANLCDIPIHQSWSCNNKKIFHCGECYSCYSRRSAISKTITDKTIYQTDINKAIQEAFHFPSQKIKSLIKHIIK